MTTVTVTETRNLVVGNDIYVDGRYATIKSIDGNVLTVDYWDGQGEIVKTSWKYIVSKSIGIGCLSVFISLATCGILAYFGNPAFTLQFSLLLSVLIGAIHCAASFVEEAVQR